MSSYRKFTFAISSPDEFLVLTLPESEFITESISLLGQYMIQYWIC